MLAYLEHWPDNSKAVTFIFIIWIPPPSLVVPFWYAFLCVRAVVSEKRLGSWTFCWLSISSVHILQPPFHQFLVLSSFWEGASFKSHHICAQLDSQSCWLGMQVLTRKENFPDRFRSLRSVQTWQNKVEKNSQLAKAGKCKDECHLSFSYRTFTAGLNFLIAKWEVEGKESQDNHWHCCYG